MVLIGYHSRTSRLMLNTKHHHSTSGSGVWGQMKRESHRYMRYGSYSYSFQLVNILSSRENFSMSWYESTSRIALILLTSSLFWFPSVRFSPHSRLVIRSERSISFSVRVLWIPEWNSSKPSRFLYCQDVKTHSWTEPLFTIPSYNETFIDIEPTPESAIIDP